MHNVKMGDCYQRYQERMKNRRGNPLSTFTFPSQIPVELLLRNGIIISSSTAGDVAAKSRMLMSFPAPARFRSLLTDKSETGTKICLLRRLVHEGYVAPSRRSGSTDQAKEGHT